MIKRFSRAGLKGESGEDLHLLLLINALADGVVLAYQVAMRSADPCEVQAATVGGYIDKATASLRANDLAAHADRFNMTAIAMRDKPQYMRFAMEGFVGDYGRVMPKTRRRNNLRTAPSR